MDSVDEKIEIYNIYTYIMFDNYCIPRGFLELRSR